MNVDLAAVRASEALIRATEHWESKQQRTDRIEPHGARPLTIALSREAGTRGAAVGRAVGARLNWPVYDNELLELLARDLHVHVKLLESVDERHVSWLQECVEAFAAVPAVREATYVHHLVESLLSLATHGNCVIVGRGAAFVLPPATTLRVRLVAPLEDRVAALMHEKNMNRNEAARFVATTDGLRSQFIRQHFQRDPAVPWFYDLLLNTAQFTITECAELIIAALAAKSKQHVWPEAGVRTVALPVSA